MSPLHGRLATLLDRYLRREIARFVAAASLVLAGAVLALGFATSGADGTILGPALGADYAGFYMAGTLLNHSPPDRLYDLRLQDRVYHQLWPGDPPDVLLTYAHAPFLAPIFRPLAWLPYPLSFAIWLIFSAALLLAGLALILRVAGSFPAADRSTALLLALSFEPLVMECWQGGQASALGLFGVALALACDRRGHPLAAGLSLGLLSYKPTLLVLILPMLAVGRRWRALAGFTASGMGLLILSTAVVGWRGCIDYARLLAGYARVLDAPRVFRTIKYVDLGSFLKLLIGGASPLARPLGVLLAIAPLAFLVFAWARVGRGDPDRRDLTWAATLTWTPVLSPYGAVYDTILIIPGLILTADVLYRRSPRGRGTLPTAFAQFLAALYTTAWLSPSLALALRFQPLTIALAAMGTYQISLALRNGP